MQIHRVLVIILIYTQTVLLSLISTNSLRREMSNLFKKINNNNNGGGILTHKGRKIQLTPDGNFIICGIDSLEDDYYGCQSSYEVYIYKTYRTGKSEKQKQVSMAATKGVKKKENAVPKSSSAAAPTPLTKPTVKMTADLLISRASDKLFDYLDTVRPSTSLFKNTLSSTTPIFATSAETRHPHRPSSNTAPTSIVSYLIKLQSRITSNPRATTLTLKSKPTVKMVYQASTLQDDLFRARPADKQFDYFDTVHPSTSLFKNMKSSSTTPIFATSAETRHPLGPRSKTLSTSIGNLIKVKTRNKSIPRSTTPTPKTKSTIMVPYYVSQLQADLFTTPPLKTKSTIIGPRYVSQRQADLFSPRAADELSDYPDTVSPSRSFFKRAKSSTTPIFATSAETRNPLRTNSKITPANNVDNLVKLDSNILHNFRALTTESNMTIETPARGTSHNMTSTRSIVSRADTQPAIEIIFN